MNSKRRRFKRTVTTIETHEVVSLRTAPRILCLECQEPSQMLTAAEAASQSKVTQLAVYRWVEAGLIHFAETDDGGLFVCPASLTNSLIEITGDKKGTLQ